MKRYSEEEARIRKNKQQNERYAADPEMRARKIANATRYQHENPMQYALNMKAGAANATAKQLGSDERITTADVVALIGKDFRCYHCNKVLCQEKGKHVGTIWEIDHLTPQSMVELNPNNAANIVACCRECNAAKYVKTEEEYNQIK
jgi:hypothetical protein